MQPDQAEDHGASPRWPIDADDHAVNSRQRALDRLHSVLDRGAEGPILVTGEPGAGKSWLVGRLVEELAVGWRGARLEMSSALDGIELLRLAGHELVGEMPDRLGAARLALGSALRDARADGRSWLLVVEEAQRAWGTGLEELQVLTSELGRPAGFAAMILVGRVELARRGPRAWPGRVDAHIHLPPLDLDEARELLELERLTESDLEEIHRRSLGNPLAMQRMASAWNRAIGNPSALVAVPIRQAGPRGSVAGPFPEKEPAERKDSPPEQKSSERSNSLRQPALLPDRPPIRLEDGLVEVGWEGDLEFEPTVSEPVASESQARPQTEAGPSEELVEDRYAALQAWTEWSRNRERPALAEREPSAPHDSTSQRETASLPLAEEPATQPGVLAATDANALEAPSLRAEMPHEHAPYGQLFSRARHSL